MEDNRYWYQQSAISSSIAGRRMDGFVKEESCCCDVDQISRKKWKKDLQRKRQVEVDKYFTQNTNQSDQ
eukprot:scaffold10556_cov258-Chaetoceros_neogracile.AAC.24